MKGASKTPNTMAEMSVQTLIKTLSKHEYVEELSRRGYIFTVSAATNISKFEITILP